MSITSEEYQSMILKLFKLTELHIRACLDDERKLAKIPFKDIYNIYKNSYKWYFLEDVFINHDQTIEIEVWVDRDNLSIADMANQSFREYLHVVLNCEIDKPEFYGPVDKCSVVYRLRFDQKTYNNIPKLTVDELNDIINDSKARWTSYYNDVMKNLEMKIDFFE